MNVIIEAKHNDHTVLRMDVWQIVATLMFSSRFGGPRFLPSTLKIFADGVEQTPPPDYGDE